MGETNEYLSVIN